MNVFNSNENLQLAWKNLIKERFELNSTDEILNITLNPLYISSYFGYTSRRELFQDDNMVIYTFS